MNGWRSTGGFFFSNERKKSQLGALFVQGCFSTLVFALADTGEKKKKKKKKKKKGFFKLNEPGRPADKSLAAGFQSAKQKTFAR
jgi:hypothetical protein